MRVKLKELKPNPYRVEAEYDEERLTALIESMETTGFWGGLTVREKDGLVEVPYGHHRVEAAKRLWGEEYEVDVDVAEIGDEEMVRRLALENSEAFSHDFYSGTVMSVQAAVRFLRATRGLPADKPFEAIEIAAFLGWTFASSHEGKQQAQPRVRTALRAIELAELGYLSLQALRGGGMESAKKVLLSAEAAYDMVLREKAKKLAAIEAERTRREQLAVEAERRRVAAEKAAIEAKTKAEAERAKEAAAAAERQRKHEAEKAAETVEKVEVIQQTARRAAQASATKSGDAIRAIQRGEITTPTLLEYQRLKELKPKTKKTTVAPLRDITEQFTKRVDNMVRDDDEAFRQIVEGEDRKLKRIATLREALLRLSARAKNRAKELEA